MLHGIVSHLTMLHEHGMKTNTETNTQNDEHACRVQPTDAAIWGGRRRARWAGKAHTGSADTCEELDTQTRCEADPSLYALTERCVDADCANMELYECGGEEMNPLWPCCRWALSNSTNETATLTLPTRPPRHPSSFRGSGASSVGAGGRQKIIEDAF